MIFRIDGGIAQKGDLGIGIFMTYLVPAIILFIPMARVVSALDLQDSWWALVIVYPTFTIPFCTWLLMGFFKTVPFEIEEAAMVDGCGQLGALCRSRGHRPAAGAAVHLGGLLRLR